VSAELAGVRKYVVENLLIDLSVQYDPKLAHLFGSNEVPLDFFWHYESKVLLLQVRLEEVDKIF